QDNGFASGTFIGAGPLAGTATAYAWSGLLNGKAHFWRLNSMTSSGWVTSATGVFLPCGYPALLSAPTSCDSDTQASVSFNWAPMAQSAVAQYIDLGNSSSFAAGTFVNVGPLGPTDHSYTWRGLPANAP